MLKCSDPFLYTTLPPPVRYHRSNLRLPRILAFLLQSAPSSSSKRSPSPRNSDRSPNAFARCPLEFRRLTEALSERWTPWREGLLTREVNAEGSNLLLLLAEIFFSSMGAEEQNPPGMQKPATTSQRLRCSTVVRSSAEP